MNIVSWLDTSWYPGFQRNWDDELFRNRILDHLTDDALVLDLGAGAGIVAQMNFRGVAARVCGIDLDARVMANPLIDEGRIADGAVIPYDDETFDVVFADNVIEHLDKPMDVFREVNRVLKSGGVFLFKTPNKWHYMPCIARMTPHWFHELVNRLRGRSEIDTFPTRYRSNTAREIRRVSGATNFTVEQIDFIEGRPEYLRMWGLTYIFGAIYERLVNSTAHLANLRILIVATLRKR